MHKNLSGVTFPLLGSLTVSGILIFSHNQVLAQVTPDNTLGDESSVVNPRDATSESIDGGAVRGQNLFHSFEEFNVGEDRGVYFANPDAVTNIFSRVTGNDVSDILGTLGVDGAANLFLINPNGIVFGAGASLDVQGSFTATTADGIEFGEQGFFSAVNPTESVLTISVPLGLQFGSNPGSIINRSFAEDSTGVFVGLQVPDGENITLVGGDINFEGGEATASGGNIEIGGLSTAGEITFNDDGSLNFPENVARADINLSNAADVDVTGTGGGSSKINARNLNVEAGEAGYSQIRAGITADSTSTEAQAGDITIDVADNLSIDEGSITNLVDSEAVGNAGDIDIKTGNLLVKDGGQINSFTRGEGNAGDITIQATDEVTFDGVDSDGNYSGAASNVGAGGEGDGGNIKITTSSLFLTNGGQLDASVSSAFETLPGGKGQGGSININVDDTLTIANENVPGIFANLGTGAVGSAGNIDIQAGNLLVKDGGQINSFTLGKGNAGDITILATDEVAFDGVDSDLASSVEAGAKGDGGNIKITANSLSLTNGGYLDASIIKASDSLPGGQGQGGNIDIQTENLIIQDGGFITSSTSGQGDSGNIAITAGNAISLDANSKIVSNVEDINAVGNAGKIEITTGSLSATKGSQINSFTRGEGNAGDITIQATDSVTFDGFDSDGNYSGSTSSVQAGGVGDGGNIDITARSLSLTNGGQLEASVSKAFETLPGGQGQGGNININIDDTLTIANGNQPRIFADLGTGAVGKGGKIDIQTGNLLVKNGGSISSSTLGQGDSGNISITANNSISLDASSNIINNIEDINAVGNAGKIKITTGSLSVTNGSQINSFTRGRGNAGDITIQAINAMNFDGLGSSAASNVEVSGVGNGGNIRITAGSLSLTNAGYITASTFGQGNAGDIIIRATDSVTFNGFNGNNYSSAFSSVEAGAIGDGGNINVTARSLSLTNGGQLDASVSEAFETLPGGQGRGGNINIDVDDTLTVADGNRPGIFASLETGAVGNAGKIDIQARNLLVKDGGQINSFTRGRGNAGDITIQATDTVTFNGFNGNNYSSAASSVLAGGEGDGGNINITARSLSLTDGSYLEASVREAFDNLSRGKGQGGDINIDVDDTLTISGENALGIFARLEAGAVGNGGNIDIQTGNLIIRDGGLITSSTSGQGDSGNISITANNSISLYDSDILNNVEDINAIGDGGKIDITTGSLSVIKGSQINSFTTGQGNAGNITIQATDAITFDGFDGSNNYSSVGSNVKAGAKGDGGNINITAGSLSLTNGGYITASVSDAFDSLSGGEGQGGNININVDDTLTIIDGIDGNVPGIFANLGAGAVGSAGNIDIQVGNLLVKDGGQINSFTRGQGDAGDITIQATDSVTFEGVDSDGNYSSSLNTTVEDGAVGDGGNISLTAGDIRLRNNSEISTYVFNGTGDGGNISVSADSVIAFDDSDIFAFAADGKGGNINLNTPAFFAENFTLNSLTADPETLYNNSRADVNATGAVSGSVEIPDVSFIQNSLTELENNSINTDELVANSCVVPVGQRKQGKFIITGGQSLSVRPGDGIPSKYPTGEVRNVPKSNHSSWQPGDPIVEPQGAYRLANGKLVLSRQCSQ